MASIPWTRQPEYAANFSWSPGDVRLLIDMRSGLSNRTKGISGGTYAGSAVPLPSAGGHSAYLGWNGSASSYILLGTDSSILLSTSSGVYVGMSPALGSAYLFTTSWNAASGANGFGLTLIGGYFSIAKSNVAHILQSTSATLASAGVPFAFAWSYNSSTGRARIAINGVLYSGTSTQTLTHTSAALGTLRNDSANSARHFMNMFLLSGAECFSDEYLRQVSINPWQIFDPEDVSYVGSATATVPYWAFARNNHVIGVGVN